MSEQIIVLSPGPANEAGSFDQLHQGTYLGGETRMQAAVELSRLRRDARFIMVGGCNISPVYGSDKVDAMVAYMQRENPDLGDRVVGLPSLPCTYHNLVAAFTLLQGEGVLDQSDTSISILTNEYHRPRTIAHGINAWQEIAPGTPFKFHVPTAEGIMGVSIEDLEVTYPAEYVRRLDLEAQGVVDIKSDAYTDSCFGRYGEQLASVLSGHSLELLTPSEQQSVYAPQ